MVKISGLKDLKWELALKTLLLLTNRKSVWEKYEKLVP